MNSLSRLVIPIERAMEISYQWYPFIRPLTAEPRTRRLVCSCSLYSIPDMFMIAVRGINSLQDEAFSFATEVGSEF